MTALQDALHRAYRKELALHLERHVGCSPKCPIRVRVISLINTTYGEK